MMAGAYGGLGGLISFLVRLNDIMPDPELPKLAETILDKGKECIEHDSRYDVMFGSAGLILSLLSLYRRVARDKFLDIARDAGNHLLRASAQQPRGIAWSSAAGPALGGFSHGVSGIAFALGKLGAVLGDEIFTSYAREALNYEASLFSAAHQNWADLRSSDGDSENSYSMMAWCHGAPGIGLAHARLFSECGFDFAREQARRSVETVVRHGFGANHSVCHGDLGNLDCCRQIAECLGDHAYDKTLEKIETAILEDVAERGPLCGNPEGVQSPGLMTGLAGIGYSLMRLANPALASLLAPL
jgi:lantibiotic modifying enzyme